MEASQKAEQSKKPKSITERLILPGAFVIMLAAVIGIYQLEPDFEALHIERTHSIGGIAMIVTGIALIALQLGFLIYMLSLYLRYKPIESVSDDLLPTCTVIVPAYNEGKLVWHTLMSLANSNYPHEKLQLIAIDDGSKDDTWHWIKLAKEQLGDRLTIHQQPKNMGKRHALHYGFTIGTGAVFVTVDSDSVVKKDTLRHMTSPFVVNKNCGAVAGNVLVLNREAVLPKMLNVSFAFTFEFVRSAQSVLGSVLCTPGALAAYRRDAVLECLPKWINQTFMGKPSDIGEDRAMTNMILKQGHHVLFQSNAYVYTNTPEKYKGLYKMFIRWERSNVRENIAMSQFAFGKFREGSTVGSRIILLEQWLRLVLCYPTLLLMLFFVALHPAMFVTSALVSILIYSSVQVFFYAKKHNLTDSFWAYPYSILYTFSLFWITPYSIATAGKGGWLTRDLPLKG
ncbi:glycosyltransferase family 2 protein [Taibaiella soli]|uniref:Glycosyltransferase family 2 protein n=2 Tax=Taibaiella soli TaxID=1649169 RepID=A0A2W2B3H6_9BACT|nr:glycosyltransferase family 2 protein [Taibaiella soli]